MRATSGLFNPSQKLTRAEFAEFMATTDIPLRRCIQGYDDGTFDPAASVSFVDAAKITSYVFDPDFRDTFCEGKMAAM